MQALAHLVTLTAPLFLLVLIGYALTRWRRWPKEIADGLTKFVFSLALPALLFRLMSGFGKLPPVDARLLIAFFGGCLVVFFVGRAVARWMFRQDGVAQSVFGIAGIFGNNVLLGVPLAKVTLGEAAIPSVSLVVVFNALILWTLVTISVEWARHRAPSATALVRTAGGVLANPLVASILAGAAFGLSDLELPGMVDRTLDLIGQAAVPLALIALGMGLAEFGTADGRPMAVAITVVKLAVQPLVVFILARWLRLPPLETQSVVVMASLPVGANVYLMSREFGTLGGPIALAIVLSTAVAAVTTPLVLALMAGIR